MATELRSEIEISAPAERVWSALMDFAAFPDWNPFIRRIEGEAKEGARIEARLEPPGGRGMTFKPTVQRVEPNREFRWLGRVGMPGLFDGEHIFEIEPLDGGRVRFVQRERFTGVLTPLLLAMVGKSTRQGFDEMNRALKERVEQQ
jgi:hypothetical protein